MTVKMTTGNRSKLLLASLLLGCGVMNAADGAVAAEVPAGQQTVETLSANDEITRLKAQLAAQQKQLEALQNSISQQQKMLEKAMTPVLAAPARLGEVATTTPMVPAAPAPAVAAPQAKPAAPASSGSNPCEDAVDPTKAPPYLRVGNTCIQPIGFMDLTAVMRDKNTQAGIGSNFGSVPLNNALAGNIGEFKFSPQNSRLGFRVDSNYKGIQVNGYFEFDFLNTAPNNGLEITNGAYTPRLRLFWASARKDKWEVLGGQSWSLLTPNRKQLSAVPGDLFYTQAIDVNYVNGLTWTRQPGVRVIYHASNKVTAGISFEQPEQYIGGAGGGSTITLPTAYAALLGTGASAGAASNTQLNNGTNNLNTATKVPDTIVKIAFDPSAKAHVEFAGLIRGFRVANPVSPFATQSTVGGGFSANFNFEIAKGLRFVSNNFYSEGGGRYLFAQAPDLIINGDGSIGLVKSRATLDGLEYTYKNTLVYAYYGGTFIDRTVSIDPANGKAVGYGFGGSNQNRSINEFTFGINQTLYKSSRYGAFNFMVQYEWLKRNLWYFNPGAPSGASDNTVYVNLRYTLPGCTSTDPKCK